MRPHYISERVRLLDLPDRLNAQRKKGYRFVQALKDDQDAILIFEDIRDEDGRSEYRAKLATLVEQVAEKWGPDAIEWLEGGGSEEGDL